jgi:DNA-binding MarR family transcriptional regulator
VPTRRTARTSALTEVEGAQQLTEVITQLRRALRASIRADIPWEALPMAQVELLQTLAEIAPARISELADRLHLANSTVSGLVAQMMRSGTVTRETDPLDRRAAVLALTPAGQAQLAEWEEAHEHHIGDALDQLDRRERLAIDRALPALSRLTRQLNSTWKPDLR